MEDFRERILLFIRDYLALSTRKFEESCGLTNGTISSFRKQGPTASVLSKIADTYPELSMDWLFRGVGNMLNTEPKEPDKPAVRINIANWNELVNLLKEDSNERL